MSDGTTIGTYFSDEEQDELLAEFDEAFGDDPGRSAAVKEAMRMYLAVDEAIEKTGYDLDERGKRMFVRQAIFDRYRAEQDGD